MHFHLFFKMAVSRCNKPSKDLYFPHVFLFLFFLLALLIKMASSPSYLLEAPCLSPVFPTLPSPSPCQMKGLFWAEAGFTPSHSHYLSCVSCHRPVCPLILHGQMWTGWGRRFFLFCFVLMEGQQERGWEEHLTPPSGKSASCWTCSSCRDTRQNWSITTHQKHPKWDMNMQSLALALLPSPPSPLSSPHI